MALIFYLSHQSAPAGGASNDLEAATAHLGLYAALAVLLYLAFAGAGAPAWIVCWQAFALTVLYGAFDEVHQGFVGGRTASELDLLLDGAGAVLGLLAVWSVSALLNSRSALRRD